MKHYLFSFFLLFPAFIISCREPVKEQGSKLVLPGHMPGIIWDNSKQTHIVYGNKDSILYVSYNDETKQFSSPELVAILPNLAASHSRGPQIAATESGLSVIAVNSAGNIFSYNKANAGKWTNSTRVNDLDTTAKEGLMAMSGDGQLLSAIWLDLRNGHNQLFGSSSSDGGKSWTANKLIYASPDTTICECCKPSVFVRRNLVKVMFRNWIDGNRDMYIIQSNDAGKTFNAAQKLGNGSWRLDGCPMDGGGLTINENNNIQTVFRRENNIYSCEPGKAEKKIGEGRSCTITNVAGKNVYAWTEQGIITCLLPVTGKLQIGKGKYPVINPVSNNQIICVWENENNIEAAILNL
jgi:hypothetical protein